MADELKTTPHETVRIDSPAKLNLCLKVTGRRPDGYHELVSIMVPVGLCDRLELTPRSSGFSLSCRGYETPADETNLVLRAAKAFFSGTGLRGGLSVSLAKRIPVAAGLGGGSGDAAAVLQALNKIYSSPLSPVELEALAVKLGADVPFFLRRGPQLARGIGEILEPIPDWPEFWYVIVTPHLLVSTAWAYASLNLPLTSGEYAYILKSLKKKPFKVADVLENDLESVTARRYPLINTIKNLLMEAGAEGALMSGSGPSVFGVFESEARAFSAKEALAARNLGDIFVAAQYQADF